LGADLVSVATDEGGLIPSSLAGILDGWDDSTFRGKPKPRALYTIPNGSNPTGGSLSEGRRREVYAIARKHQLLILEDDPYYFLQFASPAERPPSLMSMDTDGRVLRFDSMSKVASLFYVY
jgi:DNA-binding transcriptional MocR family regulator